MQRRVVVPALFAAAASAVAYALLRLRRPGAGRPREPEHPEHRCECGQRFHVSGVGRHRVYWLPEASPGDPVLSGQCPRCERPLPREQDAAPAAAS